MALSRLKYYFVVAGSDQNIINKMKHSRRKEFTKIKIKSKSSLILEEDIPYRLVKK